MRNSIDIGNAIAALGIKAIEQRLPDGWTALPSKARKLGGYEADAVLEVRAPDGVAATVLIEAKSRFTAQQAADLAPRLAAAARQGGAAALLITRFASATTQQRLRDAGVSYLDLTGNARIALRSPALYIETEGASKDPNPPERGIRSLKGAKAARLVRALCDFRPPTGVRELASRAKTDPGYASRVLDLLEQDDVISRDQRGGVADVRWRDLLRRWAQDYTVTKTNRAVPCLAARGLDAFTSRLRSYGERWALTASLAVPGSASTAPGRLASCYVDVPEQALEALDLRPADAGANVLLLEPFDSVVWDRTREERDLTCVALSQCTVDLLTGTGREPAEAESLISWMGQNENAWRA